MFSKSIGLKTLMNRDFSYFRRSSELSGLLLRAVDRGERVDECNLLGYT